MHWIITKDLINTASGDKSRLNYKCAPRGWIKEFKEAHDDVKTKMVQRFKEEMNYEFRLFDDDGVLYYEGLCKDLENADQDEAFAPLDWAMADVGATTMKYRKKGAAIWETL